MFVLMSALSGEIPGRRICQHWEDIGILGKGGVFMQNL